MKLRLHDGTLRLRLSRAEVASLQATGRVENAIVFAAGKQLLYTIERADAPAVGVTFEDANIRIAIPQGVAKEWIESDQTGIEASSGTLRLLIEKDFQCLHRPPEAGEDPFPNPLA